MGRWAWCGVYGWRWGSRRVDLCGLCGLCGFLCGDDIVDLVEWNCDGRFTGFFILVFFVERFEGVEWFGLWGGLVARCGGRRRRWERGRLHGGGFRRRWEGSRLHGGGVGRLGGDKRSRVFSIECFAFVPLDIVDGKRNRSFGGSARHRRVLRLLRCLLRSIGLLMARVFVFVFEFLDLFEGISFFDGRWRNRKRCDGCSCVVIGIFVWDGVEWWGCIGRAIGRGGRKAGLCTFFLVKGIVGGKIDAFIEGLGGGGEWSRGGGRSAKCVWRDKQSTAQRGSLTRQRRDGKRRDGKWCRPQGRVGGKISSFDEMGVIAFGVHFLEGMERIGILEARGAIAFVGWWEIVALWQKRFDVEGIIKEEGFL